MCPAFLSHINLKKYVCHSLVNMICVQHLLFLLIFIWRMYAFILTNEKQPHWQACKITGMRAIVCIAGNSAWNNKGWWKSLTVQARKSPSVVYPVLARYTKHLDLSNLKLSEDEVRIWFILWSWRLHGYVNSSCSVPHHTTQTVAPNRKIHAALIAVIWVVLKEVRVSLLYYVC